MHVEIDRVVDRGRRGAHRGVPAAGAPRRPRVGRGLGEDARAGARRRRRARADPPPARRRARSSEGAELLRWLADDHFTFLGYREYRLERGRRGARCCGPCPAPASASCAPTRTCPSSFGKLPAAGPGEGPREDPAGAGQGQLARHRAPPGLPRLRRRQDVRRAGRGRGGAALPRPVLQRRLHRVRDAGSRCCARRCAAVMQQVGFDPRSHAGKALMDTLENYPRDELFQTPPTSWPRSSQAVHVRPRAPPAAALRPPRRLRPLPLRASSTCRATATTPRVRERFCRDPHGAPRRRQRRVHRPRQRVHAARGSTSSCTRARARRSPTSTSPTSSAGWSRPPAPGATTSPPPSVRSTARSAARAWPAGASDVVPRGLQGGLQPPHRRRRPRPARGHRGRRGHRPGALRAGRRRPRRGPAQGLPRRAAAVAERRAADALLDGCRGRRRAALPARGPGPRVLHLRVRAALRRASCRPPPASSSRTRCARCGTAATRPTASTRSCSAPG